MLRNVVKIFAIRTRCFAGTGKTRGTDKVKIGTPKEVINGEARVAMTPDSARHSASHPNSPQARAAQAPKTTTPFPPKSNKYDSKLVQGFSINVTEKAIKISAHTPLGLQNAIYYLLDKWGCKWIMPGKLGECIPKRNRLSMPLGTIKFAPHADMTREAGHRIGSSKDWYTRNMSGWQNMMSTGHFWLKILPPKKYFKQHPEWYSLIAGKRQPKQLCTSNPEVIKQVIKLIKQRLRQNQIMMCFPMDPEDHINFCQCTKCTAQDIPGLKDGGAPVVTDRVVRFANAIAEGIKDEFPDRFIGIHAYSTHSTPPVKVKPASNVIVSLTRSAYCLLHLMPDKSCADSNFHSFIKNFCRKHTAVIAEHISILIYYFASHFYFTQSL